MTGSERDKPLRAEQFTTAGNAQSWWYRAVNRVGRVLPSFGAPSAEAWIDKAKRLNPGVGEPRPETLAALEALLRSVQEDAALSFSGRIAARMDCLRMAGQHLRIEQAIRETPEILATQIPSPIFLIGWMRTGTTFVHRLLSQDPDTRSMPYWESMYPVPPRSSEDVRADELARVLKQLESISPNYEAIHPMGAHEPEECVALFTNVFRTLQYNVQYRVPGYIEWLQGQTGRTAFGSPSRIQPTRSSFRRSSSSFPTRSSCLPIATPPRRSAPCVASTHTPVRSSATTSIRGHLGRS
jgi:hypothetical protein